MTTFRFSAVCPVLHHLMSRAHILVLSKNIAGFKFVFNYMDGRRGDDDIRAGMGIYVPHH